MRLTGVTKAALIWVAAIAEAAAQPQSGAPSPFEAHQIIGDAIPAPLTGRNGDAQRGRAIVANRQIGLCLLCHSGPIEEERFQGDIAPDLRGAGSRSSAGQIRLRIVDSRKINPDSIMPPYYRLEGLHRVAPAFVGKPVLSAEQIEDVIAYLMTLRD